MYVYGKVHGILDVDGGGGWKKIILTIKPIFLEGNESNGPNELFFPIKYV